MTCSDCAHYDELNQTCHAIYSPLFWCEVDPLDTCDFDTSIEDEEEDRRNPVLGEASSQEGSKEGKKE